MRPSEAQIAARSDYAWTGALSANPQKHTTQRDITEDQLKQVILRHRTNRASVNPWTVTTSLLMGSGLAPKT